MPRSAAPKLVRIKTSFHQKIFLRTAAGCPHLSAKARLGLVRFAHHLLIMNAPKYASP